MFSSRQATSRRGRTVTWILMGVVGVVAAAGGFMVPRMFASKPQPADNTAGLGAQRTPGPVDDEPKFVEFGDLVVNLSEQRMTRYLRVKLMLQVTAEEMDDATKAVEQKKIILRNWLIGYLSDKTLDEVRGQAGVNRLRREIQDHFNTILFPDGHDRIRDVLFEEFNVQ